MNLFGKKDLASIIGAFGKTLEDLSVFVQATEVELADVQDKVVALESDLSRAERIRDRLEELLA